LTTPGAAAKIPVAPPVRVPEKPLFLSFPDIHVFRRI